jgi:RNA polymerase sigma-70 factor (ECF subfamily)
MPKTTDILQSTELNINELFSKHYHNVYSFAKSKTLDQHKAEDLTSETFIKAYLKIQSYDASLNFNNWIYTICKNTFLDDVKKKKINSISIDNYSNFEVNDTSLSPLNKLIKGEQYLGLLGLIERLTADEKQIIQLYFLEDLCYEEITRILNITHANARTRLSRAKQNLRSLVTAA